MYIDPTGIFIATALSAAIFALVATMVRQVWWVWAFWGGLMGLTVATIAIGLAHAVAVPYTAGERSQTYMIGYLVTALILAAIGAGTFFRIRRNSGGQV